MRGLLSETVNHTQRGECREEERENEEKDKARP